MRAVVQRVSQASVSVAGVTIGAIDAGFLILVGTTHADGEPEARRLAAKIAGLRVFEDSAGKMNLALADINGAVLVVSQFTLYGDVRKGRRPSFTNAAAPDQAEPLIEYFCQQLNAAGLRVETGQFRTHMDVSLVNDGPVTLWVDTDHLSR